MGPIQENIALPKTQRPLWYFVLTALNLFLIILLTPFQSFSQTDGPLIEMESLESGLLPPSMTASEKLGIESPTEGLIIYQTDEKIGYYHFDGNNWKAIGKDDSLWSFEADTVSTIIPAAINHEKLLNSLKLDSSVKIGNDTTRYPEKGTIRFNESNKQIEGFDGLAWKSLYNGYTSSLPTDTIIPKPSDLNRQFGLVIDADDNRLVVGVDEDNVNGQYSGSVYVFENINSDWVQTAKLTPSNASAGMSFGGSVSIDGNYILVGAFGYDSNFQDSGAAYIFEYNGQNWNEIQFIEPSDPGIRHYFGHAVSIQGNFAVVGAPFDNTSDALAGSVYVYEKNGNVWSFKEKLYASDFTRGDVFGSNMVIDNDYLFVCAPNKRYLNQVRAGGIYVFQYNGNSWDERQIIQEEFKLPYTSFGSQMDFNNNTLVVGIVRHEYYKGAAYVYSLSSTGFQLEKKLFASDLANGDFFGSAVSINNGAIAVSSSYDDYYDSNNGTIYLYKKYNGVWREYQKYHPYDFYNASYTGMALRITDSHILAGSPFSDEGLGLIDIINR